jgi:ADP-heptose:LPS heptosyltransferase
MIIDLRGEDKTKNRLDYLEKRNRLVLSNRIPQIYLENGSVDQITVIPNALKNKVTIGISTGTNWRTRKWSIDNFKKVAEYFIKNYDIQIIELGKDCEYLGLGINLINKTSVIEVAKILKQCDIFIGNDSGLIHLSLAVNTPTVGLFGPLIPERLISEENKPFLPLRASIKCQGCWSKGEMQYPDCCPKLFPNCMDSIRPEKVIETAELLLKSRNKI